MSVNWNLENNTLSDGVLDADLLVDLLGELGCDVKWDGPGRFRGPCPVHRGDGPNFVVRTGGHTVPIIWECHSHTCHQDPPLKNNLLGLVRGARGEPGRPAPLGQARAYLLKFLREAGSPARPRAPRPSPAPAPPAWTREQVRSRLVIPAPYFVSRGFTPAVLGHYDIGYSRRLKLTVAPVYMDDGETCVGYTTRSPNPAPGSPRWRNSNGLPKSDYLFGYAQARQSAAPFVLLVEGVPDALRAAEAGVPAVACLGTRLTDTQAIKLARLERPVVVAFDNDDSGRKGAVHAAEALRGVRAAVTVRHPPAGVKDVGEMPVTKVKAWWAGGVPVAC